MEQSKLLILHYAIDIHNIGISLMERRYFTQAVETLNDAFLLLKYTATNLECAEAIVVESSEKHRQALQRLSCVSSHDLAGNYASKPSVTSTETNDLNQASMIDRMAPSNIAVFFRLGEIENSDDGLETHIAIAILNMATAYGYASQEATCCPLTRARYKRASLKLLQLSRALHCKVLYDSRSRARLLLTTESVQLMVVILVRLFQALESSGDLDSSRSVTAELVYTRKLLKTIKKASKVLLLNSPPNAPAA